MSYVDTSGSLIKEEMKHKTQSAFATILIHFIDKHTCNIAQASTEVERLSVNATLRKETAGLGALRAHKCHPDD